METEKNIYNMQLHDIIKQEINGCNITILKAYGGWIYTIIGEHYSSSCFVPDDRDDNMGLDMLLKQYDIWKK